MLLPVRSGRHTSCDPSGTESFGEWKYRTFLGDVSSRDVSRFPVDKEGPHLFIVIEKNTGGNFVFADSRLCDGGGRFSDKIWTVLKPECGLVFTSHSRYNVHAVDYYFEVRLSPALKKK